MMVHSILNFKYMVFDLIWNHHTPHHTTVWKERVPVMFHLSSVNC